MATSEQFPEIWHYTTTDGFRGIYKSRVLWATHCKDLNDSSELTRFRVIAESFASEHIKNRPDLRYENLSTQEKAETNQRLSEDSRKLLDIFEQVTFGVRGLDLPLICCFSQYSAASYEATNGLLSQWRGYGGMGGIAIVFDTKLLEQRMKREAEVYHHPVNHIGNVCYENADGATTENFSEFFELFPHWIDSILARVEPNHDIMEPALQSFIQGTTLVKHYAVHEENEVRIVVSPRPQNPKSIFFDSELSDAPKKNLLYRKKSEGEARYIELFDKDIVTPLPIRKVIVGPSKVQNLNYQTVEDILHGSGIEILRSSIPYIG